MGNRCSSRPKALRSVVRLVGLAALSIGVAGAITATGAKAQGDAGGMSIRVQGQALSVVIEEALLVKVLHEIARQAEFELEARGDLGRVLPQRFGGVPLEEGIRRLVGDSRINLIMRYEAGETGEKRLVEVTARAAGEVPAAFLEQRRMRTELSRVRIPPPPPPPPPMQ